MNTEYLNKIIQADCLEYLKNIESESVDCVIIDEPYGVLKHEIEKNYNLDIALKVRKEIYRILKKDGWFCFFSQFPNAWSFGNITFEAGFKSWQTCNEIVWCKRGGANIFNKVLRIHENIFIFQKGKPNVYENIAPWEDILIDNAFYGILSFETLKRWISAMKAKIQGKKQTIYRNKKISNDPIYNFKETSTERYQENTRLPSIWSFIRQNQKTFNNPNQNNFKHPTVKPTLLFRRLIKLFTQKGDIVLDCFSGSGTTALACKQEGRNFLVCEREEEYVKIGNDRLENWREDLEEETKWLMDRGVCDFESDIQEEVLRQNKLL